jgi:DNA-binding transcriptional ArsR family regulator
VKPDCLSVAVRAVSNPVRLQVLCILLNAEELTASDISSRIKYSQACVSQHMSKLVAARWLEKRRDRQFVYYRVCPPVRELCQSMIDYVRGI